MSTEPLQVLYSGHLQKTGGRGSYRLVHVAHPPFQRGFAAKSYYSRTYATHRGWGYTGVFVRPRLSYVRGQTNVSAAGGRSVLQRCFNLRGAAASIAASNDRAWSKGRERRKRSARREWAYFS